MPEPRRRSSRPPGRAVLRGTTLAVLLVGGVLPIAKAQSLEELYQAARGYDATYLSARALLESARYRLEQFYALRRPSVGLSVGAGRSISDTPNAQTQDSATSSGSATVNGSQTLFNRSNDATIAQAERSLDVARVDFEAAEQDLIIRVSQAYFDVLAAQNVLASARGQLAAIAEQVASAKRNFEVGTATITDTREAQARYDLARATEIAAANDLLNKRIALDQLVGRSNVAPTPLAAPFVAPTPPPDSVEDWVRRADAEHPLVRRSRLALDIARLETEKAKAAALPTVTLSGSYGRGYSSARGNVVPSGAQTSIPFVNESPGRSASIGVTMNVPLFSGFAIQNRIRETIALEDKSQNDLEASRRAIAQTARTAFYSVISGAAQVNALEAAESSSQLALEATQLGYRVGVRVNLDVLNAQAQLFNTQAQLARARYDVVLAGLRLRQASGRLTPDDVAAVNALLQR